MKALKEIGLIVLGAGIMYVVIVGINNNARLANLEKTTNQIVQVLNQAQQARTAPQPAN